MNEEMNRVWHLVNTIKLWIIMMKPKIEDGNNVGVSVQEEYITMLDGFERALSNVMSDSISYYKDRGTYLKNVFVSGPVTRRLFCILMSMTSNRR